MPRFASIVEYNGSDYCGWQRQKSLPSVQETIEKSIRNLEPDLSHITAAGRTDTGVHARGQVIHFDLNKDRSEQTLVAAINANLRPAKIAVLSTRKVPSDFHARFSATKRIYIYRAIVRSTPLVFERGFACHIYRNLDIKAMSQGASHLIGKHDFTSFRSTHCQALSPIKTLDELLIDWQQQPSGKEYIFMLAAKSFLHKQVRSIVGTLIQIGLGKLEPLAMKDILAARDHKACGTLAPPEGLYLKEVCYDPNPFLPTPSTK